MFKRFIRVLISVIILVSFPAFPFSPPQLFWPQKDIKPSEANSPSLGQKVLIASRASTYKTALIERIKQLLKNDSVYVKCIGLKQLKNENTAGYGAIILINTCMAWDWDRNVRAFLKSGKDIRPVIVLTTSGSGDWLPKKKKWPVDAVAAASLKTNVDGVAGEMVLKIKQILESNRASGTP
jgi:hypothetical protein